MSNARTIVFIHGIGNKPEPDVLKCQWDRALFGYELGERSRLAYWVNREFYPEPEPATCGDEDGIGTTDPVEAMEAQTVGVRELPLLAGAAPKKQQAVKLERMGEKMFAAAVEKMEAAEETGLRVQGVSAKVLPLPRGLRLWLTRRIVRRFLRDVNDYFYVKERREAMRRSLQERLDSGGGPFVVVAHSQGSMIAYDVLSRLDPDEYRIELFVTIGSPLAVTEVKDNLKEILGVKKLTRPKAVQRWVNVADPFDPVCLDKGLRGDYGNDAQIIDHLVVNPESPHSGTGYLRMAEVREAVRAAVDPALFQPVADFRIAKDLVRQMESAPAEARHPVLIELADDGGPTRVLSELREEVAEWILKRAKLSEEELALERLQRFVAAKLTRTEVELLAEYGRGSGFRVTRLWRNLPKCALVTVSTQTVQARPAHLGYSARGSGITWAVLDTGIAAGHPHFTRPDGTSTIEAQYDCTITGPLKEKGEAPDRHGHGTHVAGIIAGEWQRAGEPLASGMAPDARLHIYKVLADDGRGSDAWIIKALDHIAATNEKANRLVIHGVNLSLGGSFDPNVFGCGHTPLCRELRRLWRQGVVVVLAAGNEGYARLLSEYGTIEANVDLSIGDPANLDEAIAVGSTHREMPHLYGISYFSSRGPTADGRAKPDLVAPGERILSCRHQFPAAKAQQKLQSLYVEMSGTSMAAPHVSGVLAGFLSVRRQFIGRPDEMKRILLENCIDLRRERMHQGAGMPNLVKMLLNT